MKYLLLIILSIFLFSGCRKADYSKSAEGQYEWVYAFEGYKIQTKDFVSDRYAIFMESGKIQFITNGVAGKKKKVKKVSGNEYYLTLPKEYKEIDLGSSSIVLSDKVEAASVTIRDGYLTTELFPYTGLKNYFIKVE